MMIDVLMSTFNGAEYLAAQLDSILGQDFADLRILVRDDGSADSTADILERYATMDERVKIIDGGSNLGAAASFMTLASRSEADLFMFADQDDIWMVDKVSRTLRHMLSMADRYGDDVPLAVFTDLRVVDADLALINDSFWQHQRLDPGVSRDWKSLLVQNVVTGCTMMMNRAARSVILPFELPEMMHDHWCAARVARFGRIEGLAEPTVLYRQHSANVEGAKKIGPAYAASKIPGFFGRYKFYRRAAGVFGETTAPGLFLRKAAISVRRFSGL